MVGVGGGAEGQLPFWRIAPGNRDRKEEAGAGSCTHCPSDTQLPWPPGGVRRALREPVHVPAQPGEAGNKIPVIPTRVACSPRRFSDGGNSHFTVTAVKKSLTGDHLLGIVRLHVTVILPDPLRLPLLPGPLSIKWIRIIFKDEHLDLKK